MTPVYSEENVIRQAMRAAQAGNNRAARRILMTLISANPSSEDAWMRMAELVESPEQRRRCFEQVLEINPFNLSARKQFEKLSEDDARNYFVCPPVSEKISK